MARRNSSTLAHGRRVREVWEERQAELVAGGEDAIRQLSVAGQSTATTGELDQNFPAKAIQTCIKQVQGKVVNLDMQGLHLLRNYIWSP